MPRVLQLIELIRFSLQDGGRAAAGAEDDFEAGASRDDEGGGLVVESCVVFAVNIRIFLDEASVEGMREMLP